ncbi:MAG: insulinase family protein [Deltaproteobacteria bacterium]|nr:insulinase family protein [Deltaproteobacteria bacterium]MBW1793409.1 insulinase family protein [Deltaproteobacteria bacterium]MBW2331299.1 insulinase family protein [Deltaproteobacteria bacterium]
MPHDLNKTVLNNGIRIVTKQVPHARSVAMGVWVNVGARDEKAEEGGLSHVIEHMIFKGTERRTALQIAKEFDAIGGQSNAFTSQENTCYYAKVMDTHVDTMVDLLSDIFLNSVFDPGEIERERQVILQEIKMLEDTPDEHVHVLLAQALWGSHPLGRSILGTPETVTRFDSNSIKEYFSRAYQPERIVIAAAGNLEHVSFAELIAQAFEVVRKGNDFPERTKPAMDWVATAHPKNLEQVHICLGTRGIYTTDPRRHACALLNVVLGGNMSSRLFQEIRERRGLAYAIYSFVLSYCDTGLTGVYVGVDKSNTQEVLRLIAREMKRLKEEPVDDSELKNAKEHLKGGLYLAVESTSNQMTRLAHNEINFGHHIPLQELVDEIEKVTAEDILNLAQDIFQDSAVSLALLGPVDEKASYKDILSL